MEVCSILFKVQQTKYVNESLPGDSNRRGKLEVAKDALNVILSQLGKDDSFGLIVFHDKVLLLDFPAS